MLFNFVFFIISISSLGLLDRATAQSAGNWTVVQVDPGTRTEFTCIHMVGEVTLFLDYKIIGATNATVVNITVPQDAVVRNDSTCNYNFATGRTTDEQILVLQFFKTWFLTFKFTNNTKYVPKNDFVDVYQISLTYVLDSDHFPNALYQGETIQVKNMVNQSSGEGALKLFSTMNDRSYKCHSTIPTPVVANNFTLQTADFQVEAFLPNKTDFLRANVCSQDLHDTKSDLIPIIIGAALAALVVIVLIAYLIGRARTKRTVYETI